jgi:hypothetical protein
MAKEKLIVSVDGNALEYRLSGVLLARCLGTTAKEAQAHHMIPVLRRIRSIEGSDPGLSYARSLWNERVVE